MRTSHDRCHRRTGSVGQGNARQAAAHYGLRHLDTGLIYRAVAKALIDAGRDPNDVAAATSAAKALDPSRFDEVALKAHSISEAASIVSAIPQVRTALLAFQREFAAKPPGAVLDGRDIGTVICPDAEVKIYVTATTEVRASRRAEPCPGFAGNRGSAPRRADCRPIGRRGEADLWTR